MRRAVAPYGRGARCCRQPRPARDTRRAGGRLPAAATPHGWIGPVVACTIESPVSCPRGHRWWPLHLPV